MHVINLLGGSGCGKSTIASGLFYKMKLAGFKVELVNEYAKEVYWDQRKTPGQVYITAKQNLKLERLQGKVEWVITDSPLILGLVYMPDTYFKTFPSFLMELFNSYDNVNILLTRNPEKKFDPEGRWQKSVEEAEKYGRKLEHIMELYGIKHDVLMANEETAEVIFQKIASISKG